MQVPFGKDNLPVSAIHSGDIGTVAKLAVTTTGIRSPRVSKA